MGLRRRLDRWWYVWSWRARYWWLDTRQGAMARVAAWSAGVLVVIVELIRNFVAALAPPAPHQPREAIVWMVVWLIVALIAAAAVALTMGGKNQPQPARDESTPSTQDGQSVRHHFGTCRVDDSFMLAWKIVGRIPIKTKGGK